MLDDPPQGISPVLCMQSSLVCLELRLLKQLVFDRLLWVQEEICPFVHGGLKGWLVMW